MQYSFSNNFYPEQQSVPIESYPSPKSTNQYFEEGSRKQVSERAKQSNKSSGIHQQKRPQEILTRDIKLMLSKYLKDIKERYQRDFDNYFNELSQQIERYSLTYDLSSLIEAKYSKSDPLNLIPMIKFQFSSLLPEIAESLSIFTSSLRNSLTLNLNGKGTFKYEKKVIDVQVDSTRGEAYLKSPRMHKMEHIQSRPSSFGGSGSGSKSNRLGFGQIQTSHFDHSSTPKKAYGLSQLQPKERPLSRQGYQQYKLPYLETRTISQTNQIQETLARLNVDRETRQKIQSVVNQHKNYPTSINKQNQYQDYQYKSPTHSEYLIHEPKGYTYEFSKTTRQ